MTSTTCRRQRWRRAAAGARRGPGVRALLVRAALLLHAEREIMERFQSPVTERSSPAPLARTAQTVGAAGGHPASGRPGGNGLPQPLLRGHDRDARSGRTIRRPSGGPYRARRFPRGRASAHDAGHRPPTAFHLVPAPGDITGPQTVRQYRPRPRSSARCGRGPPHFRGRLRPTRACTRRGCGWGVSCGGSIGRSRARLLRER